MPETSPHLSATKDKTLLGFDFGSHWIGLAVGQTRTKSANPLKAIRVFNNQPDWQNIASHIDEWRPDLLIVGLPLSMFDCPQEMTEKAKRFSRQLEGRFHIKTILVDERLTTREAYLQCANPEKIGKTEIDSISAVLITESWLTENASS